LSGSGEVNVKPESVCSTLGQTPFPLKTSHGRKYVRIELSSPVEFRPLTLKKGKLKLSQKRAYGEILNLSEGGMLLITDGPVSEEDFMLMSLNLNKMVVLEGVLGKIKRVEPSEEGDYLVGVEFTSREELEKFASLKQIEGLPIKVTGFRRELQKILSGYLRTSKIATR
jgi:hypothetical protein